MDQKKTGQYIAKKRKGKNLTQEQLAQELGVSSKTVSKWETGRCMPDYSVVEQLCKTIDISCESLIYGWDMGEDNTSVKEKIKIIDEELKERGFKDLKDLSRDCFMLFLIGVVFLTAMGKDVSGIFAVCVRYIMMLMSAAAFIMGIYVERFVKKKTKTRDK